MKRKHPLTKPTSEFKGVKESLSQKQLYEIGAVAIAYNYTEGTINRMLPPILGLSPATYKDVVSRINGMDGKIEIVKVAAKDAGLGEEICDFLAVSLGNDGFAKFKKYRDAVVHTRVFDAALGLGEMIESKGKHVQVLITEEALELLYDHLTALGKELQAFVRMFFPVRKILNFRPVGQEREQLEANIRVCFAQAQECRKLRLSLKPLPEFPKEPEPPRRGVRLPE